MSSSRFCRFELRTTDVAAARQFYTALLGTEGDVIVELPAAAAARGAPAHWLGYLDVGSAGVDALLRRFSERGATRLGPPGDPVIVRDPGGAVLALTEAGGPSRAGVVWHVLHTPDAARAGAIYAELFGWALTERLELAGFGALQRFAWGAGEASTGAIADIAQRPGTHPHWLFFFGVADLDRALAAVRAGGGTAMASMRSAGGQRVAGCEDPQGAAFGLMEL